MTDRVHRHRVCAATSLILVLMAGPVGTAAARGGATGSDAAGSMAIGPVVAGEEPTAVRVTAPPTARAGTAVSVTVAVSGGAPGDDVTLWAVGSLGTASYRAPMRSGTATFVLDSELTGTAGAITLLATVTSVAATGSVLITPRGAVDPITPVVGARSIVADAADQSMVVAMPSDQFGNVIADGSRLEVVRSRPDGTVTAHKVTVRHQVGWALLPSGTRAGTDLVWLRKGSVTGPAAALDEVAAPPVPFTLKPVDPRAVAAATADGQSLVPIATSVLRDRHGNVQPDGTAVDIAWLGADGPSRSQAMTIAGVASMSIPAPAVPGRLSVTASCRGSSTSAPLVLAFATAVAAVPVAGARGPSHVVDLTIGPVLRPGGAFLPDGTRAAVVVTDGAAGRVSATGLLVDGGVHLAVPVDALTGQVTATATVLDATGSVSIP